MNYRGNLLRCMPDERDKRPTALAPPILAAAIALTDLSAMNPGDTIRRRREERGLSQRGLAELAGISEKQLWNVENGANTSVETLTKVATILGIESLPLSSSLALVQQPKPVQFGDLFHVVDPNPRFRRMRVEASVSAGAGGWNDQPHDEWIDLPEMLLGPNDFLVQARGDSMKDENIEDGDYVIVSRIQPNIAPTGDLVIAWLNDGLVIKRWARRGGKKVLYSANEAWPDREITPDDVFEIQAVVKHILKHPTRKAAELGRRTREKAKEK